MNKKNQPVGRFSGNDHVAGQLPLWLIIILFK
jgi:hypothetical protein